MRRLLKENGLSLFFLALFLVVLVLQAIAGHAAYNNEQADHAALLNERPETLSLWRYVTSSEFGNAVMENWQSEYLQFTIFNLATVWLVQKGSTESKGLDKAVRSPTRTRRSASTRSRTRRRGKGRAASGSGSTRTRCCW